MSGRCWFLFVCVIGICGIAMGQAQSAKSQPYPPNRAHPGPAWFVDVAQTAGLTMQNINGDAATKKYIIETTGGGVAILDYDHDGWPDIFLVNGTAFPFEPHPDTPPTSHLYHNNHDGTFTDVTKQAGLTATGWGQGACVGDYDNDGWDDLYVTYYGKNRLYHNEHNGTFKEVAETAGVAGTGAEWGTGCAFVDYDRDGKLDLMVANYVHFDLATIPKPGEGVMCLWKGTPVMCGPRGLPHTTNILYHNVGDGKFEDVSAASGITKTNAHYCFSVSTLDYDDDGWPDIYVACDSTPSILYRNRHDGTFIDAASDAGVAYDEDGREQAGMGSAIGDYNGDGRPDIFKTNFSDDVSSLYRNDGGGMFTSTIREAGLGLNTQYLGWGVAFMDVENDGWPDVLIANGHVYPEVDTAHLGSTYREPRLFYSNRGDGTFKDLSRDAGPGATMPASSRGLATADLWNDGRVEAVINNIDGTPLLLVNEAANSNHWIGVILEGTASNRDGIGAKVTVHAGSRSFVQEVRSGSTYISSSDLRLHFGLGSTSSAESIDVRWPSGREEIYNHAIVGSQVDRFVTLVEGRGASASAVAGK
ncbi:CRTAC1 family protein [Silvibacterium dinghuense]|uniref:CRTAC1 family protein n=2 Tax=Silvibacterium dinghuense TaxID=1560006 RepID=A0A4V1NVN7_9BACT|nr:CRTAC1 family protein [Silvibacterium dinghuense]